MKVLIVLNLFLLVGLNSAISSDQLMKSTKEGPKKTISWVRGIIKKDGSLKQWIFPKFREIINMSSSLDDSCSTNSSTVDGSDSDFSFSFSFIDEEFRGNVTEEDLEKFFMEEFNKMTKENSFKVFNEEGHNKDGLTLENWKSHLDTAYLFYNFYHKNQDYTFHALNFK